MSMCPRIRGQDSENVGPERMREYSDWVSIFSTRKVQSQLVTQRFMKEPCPRVFWKPGALAYFKICRYNQLLPCICCKPKINGEIHSNKIRLEWHLAVRFALHFASNVSAYQPKIQNSSPLSAVEEHVIKTLGATTAPPRYFAK